MDKEIRILILEDSKADAELIARELGKGAFVHITKWVKSRAEFLQALDEFVPDMILCDYRMPELEASEALKIVKERSPKTPFIVVSGIIGDEIALEMMRLGVADYVMKDKLAMLVPVVEREVSGILKEVNDDNDNKKKFCECERAETQTTPRFMRTSEIFSILIFFAGCVVLVGWALDIPVFKSVLPGLVTMKANTALAFIFSGLSLWALQIKRRDNPHFQRLALVCGAVVLGIGLATVLEYALGWDLGMDQLLFKELPGAVLTSSPGRMAFNTAVNFTFVGLALCGLASKKKNACFWIQILMIPTGIIAMLSTVGHLYHVDPLFIGLQFSTAMALHTAVLFLVVFLGVLFCRPGCGFMTTVSSDSPGGTLVRRLLPFTVLIPVTLGGLKILMEKMEIGSPAFGVSFVATGNLMLISLCVYILAFVLNKSDSGRKRAEEALVFSNRLLQTQQECSLDGILVVGEKGGILSFNQRFVDMWGISIDVMESKSDERALQAVLDKLASSNEFLRKVKHFYKTENEICRDEIVLKDGRIFDRYSSPVVGKDAKVYGRVWYFRDITERLRMVEALKKSSEGLEIQVKDRTLELELSNQKLQATAEDLKRANKAKSEFLANMSHELRTPLSSIIGFSEVICDEKFGALNDRQKEYAQNVLTSGRHLLSLINDILDISKVESGKMTLEVSLFSVKDSLEEVLRITEGVAILKKIYPVVEIPEDLGEIRADLRKFKQVVYNLMSNAIKFTPVGGKLGLRARRDDTGIEIAVWDTGIGIPPENLETVFEAFTRLVDTYTQETEGTGLGLTISRKIVDLLGGKIWVESEGLGHGTTAKFTIPSRRV